MIRAFWDPLTRTRCILNFDTVLTDFSSLHSLRIASKSTAMFFHGKFDNLRDNSVAKKLIESDFAHFPEVNYSYVNG